MAWDGAVWVRLKRPLTEEEKARQLKVEVAASETPNDDFTVSSMNDVFLESTNVAFMRRGLLAYGCLAIIAGGGFLAWVMLRCLNNPPETAVSKGRRSLSRTVLLLSFLYLRWLLSSSVSGSCIRKT
jgi:hypothetical protein